MLQLFPIYVIVFSEFEICFPNYATNLRFIEIILFFHRFKNKVLKKVVLTIIQLINKLNNNNINNSKTWIN